jgi:hypothetical protein
MHTIFWLGNPKRKDHLEDIVKLFLCFFFNWVPRHEGLSGGIAPRIPDVGSRWRWVVSFTSRPFYPQRKNPWSSSPSPTERWEDNIRIDLKEIGWEVVNWIHLTLDTVQKWAVVNTVMKLGVP